MCLVIFVLFGVLEINECLEGTHNCDVNARCDNVDGSFTCECNAGYGGNGRICSGKVHLLQAILLVMDATSGEKPCYW